MGWITFILFILTFITGLLKIRKLVKYLGLLTIFSLLIHIIQNPTFSIYCYIILILVSLIVILSSEKIKIRNKEELRLVLNLLILIFVLLHIPSIIPSTKPIAIETINETEIVLPKPTLKGEMSVEETLLERRSVRDFSDEFISLENLSQLLWAVQGITSEWGGRTAPSAGGTYPLEIYVFMNQVENLVPGIYRYQPKNHSLTRLKEGNFKEQIYSVALSQQWVRDAAVVFVFSAVPKRTTERYGERGIQYIFIEVGHASQNLLLEAVSLGLGAVPIGAFDDKQLNYLIGIDGENEKAVYINAVGKIKP